MRHTGIPNRAWTRPLVTSLLPAVVLLAVVACGTGDDIDLSAVYNIGWGRHNSLLHQRQRFRAIGQQLGQ